MGLKMEINKIDRVSDPNLLDLTGKTRDKGFQHIFEEKLLQNDPIAPGLSMDLKTEMLDQSDKVLDLLDNFAQQLNDRSLTLKEIAPITERIEKEMGLLESKTAGNVPQNSDIEQFLRDLSITAQVAVLKFKRGDYI